MTILIPERNEIEHIERCLESILAQTYPSDNYEVLILDGRSDDGTLDIIKRYCHKYKSFKMIDNEKKIVPTALNLGIAEARGDILIRIDGHSEIASDYISKCLETFSQYPVDCVGGRIDTIGKSFMAKLISLAMSCPFGVGNALFRYTNNSGYVDTVAFGAYKKKVFEKIGLFDEELVRNQDDEFNYRLRKYGGKIYLNTEIKSLYYSRSTLGKLWKQYYQYGFYKVRVLQKHPTMMMIRQFVPLTFVLGLLSCLLLSIWQNIFFLLFLSILSIYLLTSFYFSFKIGISHGLQYIFVLPLSFFILHFSYGTGFFIGLFRFAHRWKT